jgi:hypothetical protein
LAPLKAALAELREYADYYLAARVDGVKASVRRIAALAIVGVLAAVVLLSALAASTVLVITGMARGLAVLAGGRVWLGELAVGGAILVLFTIAVAGGLRLWSASQRRKTQQKYERRRNEQRARFGRDAAQRAAPHQPQ